MKIFKELIVRYVCLTIWFCLSLILALAIPNIGVVIKMLGSLSATFIFIFPGLCMMKCALRSDSLFATRKRWVLVSSSILYLALGGSVFGIVFTEAIKGLLGKKDD